MTAIYLLSLGILAFVLKTGLGTRELNRRRFTLPLAIVAVVGALYLRSIPTSTGDIKLITVTGAAGVLLGLVAGALMKVRVTEDGSLVYRGRNLLRRRLDRRHRKPPAVRLRR